MNDNWTRIPQPIDSDADRRALCGILVAAALEVRVVRVVRVRRTPGATPKRYVEYRDTGLQRPVTETTEVTA